MSKRFWRWWRRVILALIVLVLILGGVGAFTFVRWTQGPLPQHDGELRVVGLREPVEILRDDWGVPHIYASNAYDLFFAQGYTQAQDRWWQMEFYRATGNGRLQELTGKTDSLMGTDVFIRTVGWRRAAERSLAAMPPESLAHLQAFADGVNAYVNSRPLSELALEYNILGLTGVRFEIEPWQPVDTITWALVMSWNLSGNYTMERLRAHMLDTLGEAMTDDYMPPYPYGEKPTVVDEQDVPLTDDTLVYDTAGQPGRMTALAGNFDPDSFMFSYQPGIGSNNWVVSGERSETGMPLLADDPHLGIGMPSIWYEIGLHCQPVSEACPFDVVGFAFTPSPAVIVGHNGRIAWGVTNVPWDTQDLYNIKINPENPLQYEWNGSYRDMTVHEEVIRFGDSDETVTIQVRETHLGPIINDNSVALDGTVRGFNNDDPQVLQWVPLQEPVTLFDSLVRLNQAQNWAEFREALRYWNVPSQNIVYADVEGNIGYQTPGQVPIRVEGHSGTLPVDGTTDAYEWQGYVPYDELPRIFNPARNYIASANQALVPLSYYDQLTQNLAIHEDYQFGYLDWDYGYRGQRIVNLLEATEKHSIESFQQIHGDNKFIMAEEMTPYLRDLALEGDLADMRDWMLDWDYQLHMDSPQAAFFVVFWARLANNLFTDQLDDVVPDGRDRNMWATVRLLEDPDNVWWDNVNTDAVETRDDILRQSLENANNALRDALGDDREAWRWGELHTATFVNNPLGLSGISIIEDMVNRGPVATSGGPAIVNATSWNIGTGNFDVIALPSMRMIVDMGNLDNSVSMHTTGQSAHPFSPHYDNMIDPWRNIAYHPMLWSRQTVEAAAVTTLRLLPE